jgi:3-oxoacyl-[acyl-carrier protein] reductase
MTQTKPLAGQTALITGASRGIGRATARRLAGNGALVLAHYGASRSEADALISEIKAYGGRAIALQADLADTDATLRLAADVRDTLRRETGKDQLDILVNNAGIAPFSDFATTGVETLDKILSVNVKAPYLLTAELASTLKPGARVIFVTTAVTSKFFPGITAYAASKGAIDTLILHLAAEFGPKGVRVNGVAPGAINTDMSAWLRSEEGKAQALSLQALQRVGEADDIAGTIAFLSSQDASWITGQIITNSGGLKL